MVLNAEPVRLPAADVAERLFRVSMWDTPRAILDAVFAPRARVAVKACHASSKSHTAALAICLALYEGADVLTTAPTWEQVKTVLWGMTHRILAGGVIPLSEWGSVNQTEIFMPDGSHALGLSTNEGVRFQGWHARPGSFLLFIGDEAPGIRPDIFEAVEGISAGGDVRHLLLGNPVVASGPFYDLFQRATPGWQRYTIDAFATPNLSGLSLDALLEMGDEDLDLSARPYLVTRRWVRERYDEWGPEHPLWASRVRGAFPDAPEDALIAGSWIDAAAQRAPSTSSSFAITAGLDCAGPGEDETVLCLNRGGDILHMQAWSDADARGAVLRLLRSWVARGLKTVNVDSAGNGWFFYRDLADELGPLGVTVNGLNAGSASDELDEYGNRKYANLKAELYWNLRSALRDGDVRGLAWERAQAQLRWLRYSTPRGIITIESKEDLAKRMGRSLGAGYSPDWAEALAFALYRGRPDFSAIYGEAPLTLSGGGPRDWRSSLG